MWRQFYNLIRAGAPAIYISMFDEFNESNQIAKTAESLDFVPAGSKFIGLNEDGTACSSDYYLRLTGDGGRMLKGTIALTSIRPTAPVAGGSASEAVALKAVANGEYVGGSPLIASLGTPSESYLIVPAGGGSAVGLQSSRTEKFVCAENAGAEALVADRDALGAWETFTMINNPDGTVSFRAVNGKYVCAELAGADPLIANRDAIGPWESFSVIKV
jgi:hypothetical protein